MTRPPSARLLAWLIWAFNGTDGRVAFAVPCSADCPALEALGRGLVTGGIDSDGETMLVRIELSPTGRLMIERNDADGEVRRMVRGLLR